MSNTTMSDTAMTPSTIFPSAITGAAPAPRPHSSHPHPAPLLTTRSSSRQLPLLPVMDINFQSPDGELIGNAFTLSRVLTLTDILMIWTRGDVTAGNGTGRSGSG